MPKQFDLIAFDWDGTLMDSTHAIALSIQRASEDLGLPVPSLGAARHVIGLGLQDALAHAVPDLRPDQVPAMVARYRHHYLARDASITLFPEVVDMLDELRAAGLLLAVATGKNRVGLDRALGQSGLSQAFDATRTADESQPKPHPRMLFDLIERFNLSPERCLMVGDTTHDLLMARNAGVAALAVTYGAHEASDLASHDPLALVHSSYELRSWLGDHA